MNIATTTYPTTKPRHQTDQAGALRPLDPVVFAPLDRSHVRVDIVIPVYNEEAIMRASVSRLDQFLARHLPYGYRIVIADNASTDHTWRVAQALASDYPAVHAMHLDRKGRGRALKAAWKSSSADILVYMDVDLSTELSSLVPLIEPLVRGEAAVAIGSRLKTGSKVVRGAKREFISRSYNWLIRRFLHTNFSDAQCGFKAIRRDAAHIILPTVTDDGWFFDTELLAKAAAKGWRVHEVPVTWIEDTDSRVRLIATAAADIRGLVRVKRELALSPAWELPAFGALILGALLLYTIGLSKSGDANSFYAAAVQAGTKSWKAFFFGSFDSSSFITVDKPPFALWVMELSGRLFGFSSWSMLLPNALAGVASVALVATTVRRWFGSVSGLIAGTVLALTPVAVLMFRFNNPDAILVLLMVAAAYATTRAIETGRTKWLLMVGTLLGTAFITKMLQGLILVPVFALVYLLAGPPKLGRRLWQLVQAGFALAVAALWWPVTVMLIPAANRPYVGGSTNNSIWNLIVGYNGLGRINGTAVGSPGTLGGKTVGAVGQAATTATHAMGGMTGGGGMGGSLDFGGTAGIARMFNSAFGIEISWLLPLALIVIGAGLWLRRRQPRTDFVRAGILLWGGWLIVHAVIFSFMKGTIHPYYSVALAPGIAALVGLGLPMLWKLRQNSNLSWLWPLTLAVSSVWIWVLLGTDATFLPWLRWLIVAAGLAIAGLWWSIEGESTKLRRYLAAAGLATLLAGPIAFSLPTAASAHTGSIPLAGPSSSPSAMGGMGGMPGGAGTTGGTAPSATQMGGAGGGLGTDTADASLIKYLEANRGSAKWFAATISTISAAPIELASGGQPVMAIGGFNGSDPAPTLAQFETYVKTGQLKYFFSSGTSDGNGPGGMGTSSQTAIIAWVKAHGAVVNYGGTGGTLYDLSGAF